MLKYKNYSLIKPNLEQKKRISEIIIVENGSVFHEVELNIIVENTFHTQLLYLVDNPKNITSFSPIHITKNKYGLKRYHFKPLHDIPYAGFVGPDKLNLKKVSVNFFESFVYEGFPYVEKSNNLNSNFKYGETSMVDLSLDEEEIFGKIIQSKRRNMIKKAIKSGIIIKEYNTEEGLRIFWPLLNELHKKLDLTHLSNDYYKSIFKYYSSKDRKQAFVLVAYKNEKPVSGVFILGNKNYMHYFKGASLYGVKNEGQGELLQWEAIKKSKSLGTKYYDLCNLDKEKLPHVYRFKTGISDTLIAYQICKNNNLGYRISNRLQNLLYTNA